MTRRRLALGVALGLCVFIGLMAAFPLIDGGLARAAAGASDILLFRPGFGIEAQFEMRDGPHGADLGVNIVHKPSRIAASNRLDLRFRIWMPSALFVALVAGTPAPIRRKSLALAAGAAALVALVLVSAWLIATYELVTDPDNALGLDTIWRVAFGTAYTVFILSNPASALMPVLLWGVCLRRTVFGMNR